MMKIIQKLYIVQQCRVVFDGIIVSLTWWVGVPDIDPVPWVKKRMAHSYISA